MGMSAQQILQSDPEYLRRQMAQQEMQRLNPTGSAAGAIGALFGRGIGNIASGRSFMDTGDAGLRRVSEVQSIMSSVPFDPENPAAYYDGVAAALKQSGYGDLAVLALKESATARTQAKELSLKERGVGVQERGVGVQEGTLQVSKDKLQKDIDDAKRLERLTNAQIKKIEAEIKNLGDDRYSFNLSKDALGNLVEIIAVNKSNPSDMKRIKISEPATSAAADPAAAARAELDRRKKGKTSTMSTSSVPELDVGVSP